MTYETLEIDNIDIQIINLVQENPHLTHTEIAKLIARSQPTVGMRIRRLRKRGILQYFAGINVKEANFILSRINIQCNNPNQILNVVNDCPFIINAFRLSGKKNLSFTLVAPNLKIMERIINFLLRKNLNITNISINIITDILKDFIIHIDFNIENCDCILNSDCKKLYLL